MAPSKIVSLLLKWFAQNARDLPWRRTHDPYAIWISEIMLQQTQVKTVISYWERWMRELPTIRTLAAAESQTVHKLWEGLGYYTRARNLHKAATHITAEHGGQFPHEFERVLALPGVGRYTAGAICSIAFDQPHPILDGNVMRVLTRLWGIEGDPREKEVNARLWKLAETLVQEAGRYGRIATSRTRKPKIVDRTAVYRPNGARLFCSELNQSLMELGALVCTPRQPQCERCPLVRECVAKAQGRVQSLPQIRPRPATTQRRFVAFVLVDKGKVLVRQRPPGAVNAHLWEFPNIEVSVSNGDPARACRRALGVSPTALAPVATIRHSITRYRIRMDVFRITNRRSTTSTLKGRWLSAVELEELPFASAHKKVLHKLGLGCRALTPIVKTIDKAGE